MSGPIIDAFFVLQSEGHLLVTRERIDLLEAVVKHGNMSKAVKMVGFS
jgi:molybdenum-dependent DNA-binding transcriptional regulator ModE